MKRIYPILAAALMMVACHRTQPLSSSPVPEVEAEAPAAVAPHEGNNGDAGSLPAARNQPYDEWLRIGGTTICSNDQFTFPGNTGNLGRVRMLGQGLGPESWDHSTGLNTNQVSGGWRCRDMSGEIYANGHDAGKGYKHIKPGAPKCITLYAENYVRPDGETNWSIQGGEHGRFEAPGVHLVGVPAKDSDGNGTRGRGENLEYFLNYHTRGLNVGFVFREGSGLEPWRQTEFGFQC